MNAIDVSNYTGPIDRDAAERIKAAGVTRVIVGTQYPANPAYPPGCAHQQIPALLEVGLEVEAYVYLWFGDDPVAQVHAALFKLAPWYWKIGRLWLDVEDTTLGYTADERLDFVRRAREASELPVGIYTAAWFWRDYMGDGHGFGDLPLWAAHYDGEADLEVPMFGDWQRATMKQHSVVEPGKPIEEFAGLTRLDLDYYELVIQPLTEQEFGYAFAQLYRGLPRTGLPIDSRFGTPYLDEDGDQVHPLIVRGRR